MRDEILIFMVVVGLLAWANLMFVLYQNINWG